MEQYASKKATTETLIALGFIQLTESLFEHPNYNEQCAIYQCNGDYFCVDVEDGFRAPIIWNGPRADWDTETNKSMADDFLTYFTK